LIDLVVKNQLIDEPAAQHARPAKDARNLVHPGRAVRSGEACNKTTALTTRRGRMFSTMLGVCAATNDCGAWPTNSAS
jgi:hypothetical protein